MSSTIEQATLTAPDISCDHCVATVQETVSALEGVSQVEASEETKKIEVSFDPQRVSLDQIRKALGEAGYPATV